MSDFKRMAVFAAVAQLGSLSAAGRQLKMSTSAVSQQLRALERTHGVTLLHRSTRKQNLTEAGERYARHCIDMVAAADKAQQQLSLSRDAPVGQLRISAPGGFAQHVAAALTGLLAAYPELSLHLMAGDEMIDLIDARVDVAIRGGRLADSNWSAKRLCQFGRIICAAPSYLARQGEPASPAELHGHQWIASARDGKALDLHLTGDDGSTAALVVEPRITSNSEASVQQLCSAGLGLASLVHADCSNDLRSGRLVPVLSQWTPPGIPVWAMTPQRDAQPAKVRHAVAALQAYLLQVPGAGR